MSVDQSLVGRAFPPTRPYAVSEGKVREFAAAIGAEYGGGAAPATFLTVLAIDAMNSFLQASDLDLSRIVHGDQRFVYQRPVVPGDVVTASLTVASLRQIGGNDIIGTRSDVTDAAGALVCTTTATLVHREGRMSPGEVLAPQTYRVTRADLVRYAGASGDFNPIHWSDRVATSVGLPGVIAHGMFTMALAGRAVAHWTGCAEVVELGCKFTNPVLVPDDDAGAEVMVAGTVKDVADGLTTIALEVTCGGQKVLGMPRAVVRA